MQFVCESTITTMATVGNIEILSCRFNADNPVFMQQILGGNKIK
jgi:hypothetical protein